MRYLLDSNLSHRVAASLREAGLDAEHVRDHGLQHTSDAEIMRFARDRGLVIVSEDTDFGQLLAEQRAASPSFVLLRTYEPLTPDEQTQVLVANLPAVQADLERGAIVVVERNRIRVRQLPVLPPIPQQRAD